MEKFPSHESAAERPEAKIVQEISDRASAKAEDVKESGVLTKLGKHPLVKPLLFTLTLLSGLGAGSRVEARTEGKDAEQTVERSVERANGYMDGLIAHVRAAPTEERTADYTGVGIGKVQEYEGSFVAYKEDGSAFVNTLFTNERFSVLKSLEADDRRGGSVKNIMYYLDRGNDGWLNGAVEVPGTFITQQHEKIRQAERGFVLDALSEPDALRDQAALMRQENEMQVRAGNPLNSGDNRAVYQINSETGAVSVFDFLSGEVVEIGPDAKDDKGRTLQETLQRQFELQAGISRASADAIDEVVRESMGIAPSPEKKQ